MEDYLIICGDVGVCGFSASDEAETRNILRNLPVTTLFVDGNHENFEQLNSYSVETWNGGTTITSIRKRTHEKLLFFHTPYDYFLYRIIFSQFSGKPISLSNCSRVRCGHCLRTLLMSLVKPDLNALKSSSLIR